MRRQSNPITPHETWLELFWSKFDFVLSLVFKYKALVGVLSSSIWVLYKGRIFLAATDRKNITDLFCFERAHFIIFYILFFFHGVFSLPFFVLNILLFDLFTFSYGNFFSVICLFWHTVTARDDTLLFNLFTFSYRNFFFRYLFVLTYFDSSRRHTHATTHATGTQIVRAKMTSLDAIFYRGNMSRSRSHARFCRRKHKKSTARASRSWKEFELDL